MFCKLKTQNPLWKKQPKIMKCLITILYWSFSICARSESLSNIDMFKPSVIACWSLTTGCNCLWSPISTTCFALEKVIGTRDSSSMHMPHSSMIHCWTLSQAVIILWLPATEHVHSIIWAPDDWSAQVSALPINWGWENQ